MRALCQVIRTRLDSNRQKTFQRLMTMSNPSVHSDPMPEVSIEGARSVRQSAQPRSSAISRSPHSSKCSDQSNLVQNSRFPTQNHPSFTRKSSSGIHCQRGRTSRNPSIPGRVLIRSSSAHHVSRSRAWIHRIQPLCQPIQPRLPIRARRQGRQTSLEALERKTPCASLHQVIS